jgi:anti-anti-sigma regulatory factor
VQFAGSVAPLLGAATLRRHGAAVTDRQHPPLARLVARPRPARRTLQRDTHGFHFRLGASHAPSAAGCIAEFCGEHDVASDDTRSLLERLVAENSLVVADVCSATFIDSSFLSCLLVAERDATERGHDLRLLVCDTPSIETVLKVSGLNEHFRIIASRDAI